VLGPLSVDPLGWIVQFPQLSDVLFDTGGMIRLGRVLEMPGREVPESMPFELVSEHVVLCHAGDVEVVVVRLTPAMGVEPGERNAGGALGAVLAVEQPHLCSVERELAGDGRADDAGANHGDSGWCVGHVSGFRAVSAKVATAMKVTTAERTRYQDGEDARWVHWIRRVAMKGRIRRRPR
jgi:hypothetical protein